MNIFISFEARDNPFLSQLLPALNKIRARPITLNLQNLLGDDVNEKSGAILENCNYVIVILSQHYTANNWMLKELDAFLQIERGIGKSEFIIPIKIDQCATPSSLNGRTCIDFTGKSFEDAFEQLVKVLSERRRVFVIMKFNDPMLDSAYRRVIKPVFKEFHYSALRIDEVENSGDINDQIIELITNSELIFADLTGKSPNCCFEVGYAYALDKSLVLTMHEKDVPIPFDLAPYRFILWQSEAELENRLRERLRSSG